MDLWNPQQYNRFQQERSQPFWDLAAGINWKGAKRLLDIGCGTGELTAELAAREQVPYTLGFDSSANMLKEQANQTGKLEFRQARVEEFTPDAPFDVVFSNAALQWVPDHDRLFGRLLGWLSPGGQLAVQMPTNFSHPSHALADELASELDLDVRKPPVLSPDGYARLLWDLGFTEIDVRIKVYLHPMKNAKDVVEWTKGTLLTHYQKQLDAEGFERFVHEYTRRLLKVIGDQEYLYTFLRLMIWAKAPGK